MMNRQQREAEMREKYPNMFTHPGCKPGEVWLGDEPFEFAQINTHLFRTQGGCPSTRLGTEKVKTSVRVNGVVEECDGFPIFVSFNELMSAIEKKEQEIPKESAQPTKSYEY